jgi:simple sugar transport system ATP-binding protein
MGHIPEDRHKHGLVLAYSVADNQVLSTYHRPPFARWMIRNPRAVRQHSQELIDAFDIRAVGPETPAAGLSGGSQQRVVASRELSRQVCFLLANQPSRGLDVGATADMRQRIAALCDRGAAVLLISSELEEILALSDRIGVMYRGRIAAEAPAGEMDRHRLGMLMAGGRFAPVA